MLAEKLVGAWRLVDYEYRRSDGELTYPFGRDPVGILMYSADGYMSAQISRRHRQGFAAGNRWSGTTEEMAQAYRDYLAYFGSYQIREAEGEIIHQVESSLFPDYIESVQRRFFEYDEGRLTLRTPPLTVDRETVIGRLTWARIES